MRFGLSEEDISKILNEISSHLGTIKNPLIYIYGSRVKGNHRKYSDIDILLCADKYDEIALKKIDFGLLNIPYKVDFLSLAV
jgi:predicted nucleotidyltransferase